MSYIPAAPVDVQPDQQQQWSRIPPELRALPQWVLADRAKKPRTVTGGLASPTDPATWTTFDSVVSVAAQFGWNIGFVISKSDPFCCIDIDVKDDTPAEDLARFKSVIATLDSYTERSCSGRGSHVWVRASIGTGRRRGGVEVYSQEHYMICTGDVLHDLPIQDRADVVSNMISQMEPPAPDILLTGGDIPNEAVAAAARVNTGHLGRLFRGENIGDFRSQSEADLALVVLLWPQCSSPRECWATFRLSALGQRPKAGRPNYMRSTLALAAARVAKGAEQLRHGAEVAAAFLANMPLNDGESSSKQQADESKEAAHRTDKSNEEAPGTDQSREAGQRTDNSGAALLARLSVDWSAGDDVEVPDIVDGLVADEDVTLLGGHGGMGKSILGVQTACAVATGEKILHRETRQCRVLYYSAEDGRKRLTRRLRKLIECVGYDEEVLRKNLRVLDASEIEPLYGETVEQNDGKRAAFIKLLGPRADFRNLQRMVEAFDADFVIIDGASDTFDGNEIARREVRAFVKMLRQVHPLRPIGVLLNVHIDRSSARGFSSNDGGYAGSAAWHNSCRRRLFLQQEVKREYDEDTKQSSLVVGDIVLRVMKNQDGPPDPDMVLERGMHGLWRIATDLSGITGAQKDEADHGPAILCLIADYYERDKFMSTSLAPQASTGVYATLKGDPHFPRRLTRKRTNEIVRQLERDGLLIPEEYKRGNRAVGERWAVARGPSEAN